MAGKKYQVSRGIKIEAQGGYSIVDVGDDDLLLTTSDTYLYFPKELVLEFGKVYNGKGRKLEVFTPNTIKMNTKEGK